MIAQGLETIAPRVLSACTEGELMGIGEDLR